MLGDSHPTTAQIYDNLGLAYGAKRDYDRAIEYHEKSLEIKLIALDETHPSTAETYNNLGLIFHLKGEYDKAIKYYEKKTWI